MESLILVLISSLSGTIIGGLISFFLQNQRHEQELEIFREQHKTEFMAEETAKHFLSHKGYTDRTFEILKSHLGGFEADELRKILVRAGAIRVDRGDGVGFFVFWNS